LSQYVHGETEENIKRLPSGREVWELWFEARIFETQNMNAYNVTTTFHTIIS
jgi:hypothetical protein